MNADVVVVTWRSGERVLGCIERLVTELPEDAIVVVDNASGDTTVRGVRARFPSVRVLELDRNVGFGAAVNKGARIGRADAVILVNDDVEVAEGCVRALLAPLIAEPASGMVAGMTLTPGAALVDGFGIELDGTLAAYNRLRNRPPSARAGRLAMPSGGLAAYRRAAFDAAGGFDERLFAYGEDVDLGLRLRLAGWTVAEAPDARGIHAGGATIGPGSPRQRELGGFARGFLLRRYGVLRRHTAARALLFEVLVIGWGLARHRTLAPFQARLRGWRAAGAQHLHVPPGIVDPGIGMREAFRRLRAG